MKDMYELQWKQEMSEMIYAVYKQFKQLFVHCKDNFTHFKCK